MCPMPRFSQSFIQRPEPIALSKDEREAIAALAPATMTDSDFATLEKSLDKFVSISMHDESRPDAANIKKKLENVRKHSKHLLGSLQEPRDNWGAETTAIDMLDRQLENVAYQTEHQRENLLVFLNILCRAATRAISDVGKMALPVARGPKVSIGLAGLVRDVGQVFETLGGNTTVNYKPITGKRGSPFIRFLYRLMQSLPASYRPNSESQLAEQVHHLKKKLSGKGKLQIEKK